MENAMTRTAGGYREHSPACSPGFADAGAGGPAPRHLVAIMASSICVPCNMPYFNNIWLPRSRGDRPPAVPERSTNLGFIGQYVEVPREIAFTSECSVRSACEARPRAAARLSGSVRSEGAV